MTLDVERLFSTQNPCAIARSHCQHDYWGLLSKEPASPFGNQAEIIQEGPATGLEQFALGPDPGNADRKIGILQLVLIPDHEPCFKASIPSYSWDHTHRVEIGCSQGRKITPTFQLKPALCAEEHAACSLSAGNFPNGSVRIESRNGQNHGHPQLSDTKVQSAVRQIFHTVIGDRRLPSCDREQSPGRLIYTQVSKVCAYMARFRKIIRG